MIPELDNDSLVRIGIALSQARNKQGLLVNLRGKDIFNEEFIKQIPMITPEGFNPRVSPLF